MITPSDKEKKELYRLPTQKLDFAAYTGAAIAAFGTWARTLNDAMYENFKRFGGITDIRGTRLDEVTGEYSKAYQNVLKKIENTDFPQQVKKIDDLHSAEYKIRKQEMGIRKGFPGLIDEWNLIGGPQRREAVFNGLTIGLVVIGALFAVKESKGRAQIERLTKMLEDRENERKAQNGQNGVPR